MVPTPDYWAQRRIARKSDARIVVCGSIGRPIGLRFEGMEWRFSIRMEMSRQVRVARQFRSRTRERNSRTKDRIGDGGMLFLVLLYSVIVSREKYRYLGTDTAGLLD